MLPANLLSSLRALALTDRPLISATPDKGAANAKNKFEVGQQLQATVQAQVAPNVFRVRVADQLMQMQLPAFVKSGDTIQLQVASLLPRLTFTLAASSNPVSTPESLSSAARLLSSLSQQPLERSYVRPIQSAPLWTGAQTLPDTTQLAGKLHEALSQSGLFYESHQAQWIAGMRPTSQLLLEPQNQLPPNQPVHTQLQGQSPQSQLAPGLASQADTQKSPGAADGKALPLSPTGIEHRTSSNIPDHLQSLVQQQLNALETRQVLWQGQVWQGQNMTWEVRDESPHRNAQGEEINGHWITQIHLDMPNLGGVTARLSLTDGALNLKFDASDADTREKLSSASSQLIAALSERGIPVTHTQITGNEHAG